MNARGERIIVFGDSLSVHIGSIPVWNVDQGANRNSAQPGDLLASLLFEQGAQVRLNAKGGRSAWNYFTVEPYQQLIADDLAWRPTKIVFVLGTNDVGMTRALDEKAMKRLYDAYKQSGAELWAIGPFVSRLNPNEIEATVQSMKRVWGMRFIDGRSLTQLIQPGADGIHYNQAGARALSLAIADALLSALGPKAWVGLATGAAIVVGAALAWSWYKRRRRGLAGVEIVNGKRWNGSTAELVRSGHRQIPCKSGLDTKGIARCWTSGTSGLGAKESDLTSGYRVAYVLVTRRNGQVASVRAIVDAPRPLTLAEAEAWRRKWGRTQTAWIETMDGTFVPVKGAKRPGKFIDDARPDDVHALLTRGSLDGDSKPVTFTDLIRDEDPAAMDVAEDFLLERGWKLRRVTGGMNARNFTIDLKPLWLPREEWKMVQINVDRANGRRGDRGYMWTKYTVANGPVRVTFEMDVKRTPDDARKAAVANGWAIAKAIKTLPPDTDKATIENLVKTIIKQGRKNMKREELFG